MNLALEKYRQKYTYLNEDTLNLATEEVPELLVEILSEGNINSLSIAYIIEALALGAREEYLNLIKSYTNNPVPLIREAVVHALFDYWQSETNPHPEIEVVYQELFKTEPTPEIKRKIMKLLRSK